MKRTWPGHLVIGAVVAATALWALSGCAAKMEAAGKPDNEPAVSEQARKITGIDVAGTQEGARVVVRGTGPLKATWVDSPFSHGVVLYFEDTVLSGVAPEVSPPGLLVERVTSTQSNTTPPAARVEIALSREAPHEVKQNGSELEVLFRAPAAPGESAEAAPVEEDLTAEAGGKAAPPAEAEETAAQVPAQEPAGVVAAAPAAETAAAAPAQEEQAPAAVEAEAPETSPEAAVQQAPAPAEAPGMPASAMVSARAAGNMARVEDVTFRSDQEGRSTIRIRTTRPVEYEVVKAKDNRVLLKLLGARISDLQERPLITTRFDSAVDRVTPAQKEKDTVVVLVELRELVPYHVEQKNGELLLHVEASDIPPRPLAQAGLPPWESAMDSSLASAETQGEAGAGEAGKETAEAEAPAGGGSPVGIMESISADTTGEGTTPVVYTGEKIALDFYKTDIKNVFRILKEVSGMNFAIDRDVEGEVTLSLEKPVPWDQVLHLVLKMNQLGMVRYGDIIRIAPVATLDAEHAAAEERKMARLKAEWVERQAKEDQLAAEKAAREMEPLVTVYIPVNYTTANNIKTHVDEIKTPDRGRTSVDERTNTVIMTDTQTKIDRAMEIVRELDRVTPQVMIEARIVEATTSFSREIGLQWGGDVGIQPGDTRVGVGPQRGFDSLGGTYGFDWAVNFPNLTSRNPLSFNFSRIMGLTPLEINATLNSLETRGTLKIVSAPKVLTLDNKKATIKQGLEFPVLTLDEAGNTTVEYRDVDLLLEVTPHVTRDRRVSMDIKTTKNDLGENVDGGRTFTTKEAETELLINDGDTVVIGGIIKTTNRESTDGFPWLMNIPGLGWLFKSNTLEDDREELLVFITPRIVNMEQR